MDPVCHDMRVVDLHSNLLRCSRHLGRLFDLGCSSSECIFKVAVDRIIRLAFAFRQREEVEAKLLAL